MREKPQSPGRSRVPGFCPSRLGERRREGAPLRGWGGETRDLGSEEKRRARSGMAEVWGRGGLLGIRSREGNKIKCEVRGDGGE